VTKARVGFLFEVPQPIEVFLFNHSCDKRIEQESDHIVGERAANEKLHGEIIDTFRIFAVICVPRTDPSLRQDIPRRTGDRFKTLTWTGRCQINDVVEDEVPLIERIVCPCEWNRVGPVWLEKLCFLLLLCMRRRCDHLFCAHRYTLSVNSRTRLHAYVTRIVPQSDHWLRGAVFIAQDAQTGRLEQEVSTAPWFEPEPASSKHPKEM